MQEDPAGHGVGLHGLDDLDELHVLGSFPVLEEDRGVAVEVDPLPGGLLPPLAEQGDGAVGVRIVRGVRSHRLVIGQQVGHHGEADAVTGRPAQDAGQLPQIVAHHHELDADPERRAADVPFRGEKRRERALQSPNSPPLRTVR